MLHISRSASHAGTWYTDQSEALDRQLSGWLSAVPLNHYPAKAIICPHAGYTYSGSTAAYGYKQIDPSTVSRVFVLGPSHHVYLDGCALSPCTRYETPIGALDIDLDVYEELKKTKAFSTFTKAADEAEHSLEMHLPYIRKVFAGKPVSIVPIVVGSISSEKEKVYGQILAPYLDDPRTIFVVSSDFCHWGKRFSYTYYKQEDGEIYESIEVSFSQKFFRSFENFFLYTPWL
eukprot:Colp12_sorted_trinity150504_noHs@1772